MRSIVQNGSSLVAADASAIFVKWSGKFIYWDTPVLDFCFGYTGFWKHRTWSMSYTYYAIYGVQCSVPISHILICILKFTWFCCKLTTIAWGEEKRPSSLHYSALSLDLQCIYASMTSFHAGSIMSHFASHIPVASSQKPSRSRSFCGGALNRGDEGLPYAFRRLLPHPRLFRVLTPVMGLVPLAYLHNAYKNSVRN